MCEGGKVSTPCLSSMKWFLLLVVIGLSVLAYNLQTQITQRDTDLEAARQRIGELEAQIKKSQPLTYDAFKGSKPSPLQPPPNPSGAHANPLDARPSGQTGRR